MPSHHRIHHLTFSVALLLLWLLTFTPLQAATGGNVYIPLVQNGGTAAQPPVAQPPVIVPPEESLSPQELEAIRLTNELRRVAGCPELVLSGALEQAAQLHSADMANHGTISHQGSDGSWPWDRAEQFGYTGPVGENIAAGYATSTSVVEGWRTSGPHYQNITNCAYRDIGLSVETSANGTFYWTQILGQK